MYNSLSFFDGTYFICHTKPSTLCESASAITLHKVFGGGTYEWTGKMSPAAGLTNNTQCGMGFEKYHGNAELGIIAFVLDADGAYRTYTGTGGATTKKEVIVTSPVQDWTTEKIFRVEWTSGQVIFKVWNGASWDIVNTHTTNVPPTSAPESFFLETTVGIPAAVTDAWCYVKKATFTQIA
jgi:hypothetical protein